MVYQGNDVNYLVSVHEAPDDIGAGFAIVTF